MLIAFPVLILTPGRSLWPAKTSLAKLHAARPASHGLERALDVYKVYSIRSDPLAQVRELLPEKISVVGFMAAEDDIDISMWRPFGGRIAKHVLVTDSADQIRQRGIDYIVVGGLNLKLRGASLEDWLHRTGAQVVARTTVTVKVAEGPQPWYIVRLKD